MHCQALAELSTTHSIATASLSMHRHHVLLVACSDTFDKTKRTLESVDTALRGSAPTSAARDYKLTSGIYAALDCFLWQMLASVALPGKHN